MSLARLTWGRLLVVIATALPLCVHAMEFETGRAEGIGFVVLAKGGVEEGDAQRLQRLLQANRVDEVWLDSPGGDSNEGQRIGHVLRRNGMAVRIRSGHSCASACTVAFLGGVLRTIEPDGEYHVHARSQFRNSVPGDLMRRVRASPGSELERFVISQRERNREFVRDRLMYIQFMLGGRPAEATYRSVMARGLETRPAFLDSPDFTAAVARVAIEQDASVHSVLLDIERSTFDEALNHAKTYLGELGPRAVEAHRMMEAMFATMIIRTSLLSQETLLRLGFVTPVIGR